MTLEAAIRNLIGLERSDSDFKRERVNDVVVSHVVGLGFGTQAARENLADEFKRRAPATERTDRILKFIREGERPSN